MSTTHAGLLPSTTPVTAAPRRAVGDAWQWHRRGLRSPAEINALVHARVHGLPEPTLPSMFDADPAYGDFFIEPTA